MVNKCLLSDGAATWQSRGYTYTTLHITRHRQVMRYLDFRLSTLNSRFLKNINPKMKGKEKRRETDTDTHTHTIQVRLTLLSPSRLSLLSHRFSTLYSSFLPLKKETNQTRKQENKTKCHSNSRIKNSINLFDSKLNYCFRLAIDKQVLATYLKTKTWDLRLETTQITTIIIIIRFRSTSTSTR